jgi:hypothetical protein
VAPAEVERPLSQSPRGLDLPTPPREAPQAVIRRWWRSRGSYRGLPFWLITRGLPLCAAFGLLYVVSGAALGWREAFDVSVHIMSPAETVSPWLAYVLSVAGWLVVPGIAGAVAGHVVSNCIESRRQEPADRVFEKPDGA